MNLILFYWKKTLIIEIYFILDKEKMKKIKISNALFQVKKNIPLFQAKKDVFFF